MEPSSPSAHVRRLNPAPPLLQITKSARLEDIRLTILNNLMLYHPESTYELAWGLKTIAGYESDGVGTQLGVRSKCVAPP